MTSVLLPLLLAVQAAPSPQQPVLDLNVWPRSFVRYGEPVEVTVHTDRDGFLTVLRVDTHGRLHVLFPLDPTDDAFVQAGERVRVYDRHRNQAFAAFAAFERDGEGTILAALSEDPYDFADFASGSRWSYGVMGVRHAGTNHVDAMLDFVRHVAGTDRFDQAVVRYWVSTHRRFGFSRGYWNASCFGYDGYSRFGAWGGHGWGWGSGWGFYGGYDPLYGGYDPLYAVGYAPLHSIWYDDLFYSPYDCYGRRPFGYYGGGTVVIIRDQPGLPVDRGGFKKKKGTVVKPYEPRRRDPAAAGAGTAVARDRTRDLRSLKPARPADGTPSERSWADRDRTVVRRRHDPQEPDVRQRDFSKRDGGGNRDNGRDYARPRPQRPDRDRSVDRPARPRPRPAADRPAPQRPAVERPAEKPKEKPKEKPRN